MSHPRQDSASIRAAATLNRAFAVILTCADSRVAPEIIFDQGIGDLFTIRVAGNVTNGDEIASVEYAVEQFHIPLCVVMGHHGCRAVEAVMSGTRLPLDQHQLFRQITTACETVRQTSPRLAGLDLTMAVMRKNVFQSVEELTRRFRQIQTKVRVIGAEYQTHTGQVIWFDGPLEVARPTS